MEDEDVEEPMDVEENVPARTRPQRKPRRMNII